ncbi:unnamed protein product [Cylicocyclus nassatus]|uniref:SAM-dependent methyltransferase Erg6/SMT-type domain-containing protein n=1 Tax=Cylicocyclus nassatus TaxID=53992 RepID=A0AA36GU12_CYLNA|nr:unnamed protein product [Cylicocyclus nassatus]
MAVDMKRNYLKLLMHFRRHDLIDFAEQHDKLFEEAKQSGDHSAVTSHYYSVMSTVIDEYFGGNFHFAPPRKTSMTLEEALADLHRKIGERLGLKEGKSCADIGCGIGGVIKDLASTGADLTGITIAANEVEIGNAEFHRLGIHSKCRLIEGDCYDMPLEDSSKDAAYAIYSLKYFRELDSVMKEVSRILKPGGKFLVYDLIKTDRYDEKNPLHIEIIEGLEYACGMPSLHTREELLNAASRHGLLLEEREDLSLTNGSPFHFCFSHSPFFMWLVESAMIKRLIRFGQHLRILPKGFSKFNAIFLAGTVQKIVEGGRMGILSGSELLVFRKTAE